MIGGRPIVRHKEAARSRAFSDASEKAEDGGSVELQAFQKSLPSKSKSMRPVGGRINIGARKYD